MQPSELGLEHWIVIALTASAFIFMGLWFAWLGRRYRWPAGVRRTGSYNGYTVHVVVAEGENLSARLLATASSRAVAAAAEGWALAGNGNDARERISEVVVYFAPSKHFDGDPFLERAAAYLGSLTRPVGSNMPMAVVRAEQRYFDEVRDTGEPVIHEMLHALARQFSDWKSDRQHTDPRVWQAAGKERSAQFFAREQYKRFVG